MSIPAEQPMTTQQLQRLLAATEEAMDKAEFQVGELRAAIYRALVKAESGFALDAAAELRDVMTRLSESETDGR